MAFDKLTEYSATNASNTVVGDVDVTEGMLPSNVNNAIREIMTHLKNFAEGTDGINVISLADDDASASVKLQAPGTVSSTVTFTLPGADGSANQILKTNGSGVLSFTDDAGGGGTYKGENGEINAGGGDIFRVHQRQLDTNVTIDADENALAAGPLTIASGVTLTVNGDLVIA